MRAQKLPFAPHHFVELVSLCTGPPDVVRRSTSLAAHEVRRPEVARIGWPASAAASLRGATRPHRSKVHGSSAVSAW